MSEIVKVLPLVLLLLASMPLMADETITLLPASPKQTWIAFLTEPTGPIMGTSHASGNMNPTTMAEIVAAYVNDLGFTGLRWNPAMGWVNSGNGYEPTNDNADPATFPGGWLTGTFYPQVEADFFVNVDARNDKDMFDDVVKPIRDAVLVNGEGFTLIVDICCVLADLQTHQKFNATAYEDEYAEFAVAMIQWTTDNYSFQPDYWTVPLNEPGSTEYTGDTPRQPVKMANAFTSRMSTEGWATLTAIDENVTPAEAKIWTAFCDGNATCKAGAGILLYHGYDYSAVNVPTAGEIIDRNDLRTRAAGWGPGGAGVPTGMTEICCGAFVGGQDGSYDHGLQMARDIFWNMTEADVSMWMPLALKSSCGAAGCPTTNGDVFAVENSTLDDWYKFPSYFALRQFSKWIRPGMIRVDTSCSGCTAEPTTGNTAKVVAFKRPDDTYVIVAINDRSVSTTMTFTDFPLGQWNYEGIHTGICTGGSGVRNRCTPDTGTKVGTASWDFTMVAEAIYTFSQAPASTSGAVIQGAVTISGAVVVQ